MTSSHPARYTLSPLSGALLLTVNGWVGAEENPAGRESLGRSSAFIPSASRDLIFKLANVADKP